MISVTVAAHGRAKRVVGGNLRAYGSGRLSICDLDRDNLVRQEQNENQKWRVVRLVKKLVEIFTALVRFCLPFLFSNRNRSFRPKILPKKIQQSSLHQSPVNKLDDETLFQIISLLDAKTIVNCERVCQRWNGIVAENINDFPKVATDQIRILFDEGEVVIYPIDEKRCPTRYPMPSLQVLATRLRHLTTQSLFVRGLIPVESCPVLRLLNSLSLQPQQIYFIWSKFSPDSICLLEELMQQNSETVTDFGLEECSPSNLLTDKLLAPVANHLTSLRLWNNGKGSHYSITDETVYAIANGIANGVEVETIDIATCILSNNSIITLINAWYNNPHSDLSISFSNCGSVQKKTTINALAEFDIFFEADQRIRRNGFTLTFFC